VKPSGRLLAAAGLVVVSALTQGCAAGGSAGATGHPAAATAATTAAATPATPALTPTTAPPSRSPSGSPSGTRPAAAASTASPTPAVVRGTVSGIYAAAGVRQWLHCQGSGGVTLVVIPGLGTSAAAWSGVLPALQRVTRTCVYDRPGLGHSPARPNAAQVLDAGLFARELAALLAVAGEKGPYVVLGHSFGGLIARAFVHAYPRSVRGVLLAESVTPGDPTTGRYWPEAGHQIDMVVSSTATGGGPPMGRLPLLVLSASNPEEDHLGGPTYGQPQWMIDLWRRQQHDDLTLSTDSIQVIAHSGHVLQQDNPGAVVEAVRELVAVAPTGAALRCTAVWSRYASTCS
jgi:pimeloyl-ACP methyl ester carboxylesterase